KRLSAIARICTPTSVASTKWSRPIVNCSRTSAGSALPSVTKNTTEFYNTFDFKESNHVRRRQSSLRLHAVPPLRAQRHPTSRRFAGTLAQLRRRRQFPKLARNAAPRLRSRHHSFRSRQQLWPALRFGRRNFRQHLRERFSPLPRRVDHFHQGRLGHVARSLRQ